MKKRINPSRILNLHSVNTLSTLNLYAIFTTTLHNLQLCARIGRTDLHNNHYPFLYTLLLLYTILMIGAVNVDNTTLHSQNGTPTDQTN